MDHVLNAVLPNELCIRIINMAYPYSHKARHHTRCNLQSGLSICNCMFRRYHEPGCKFINIPSSKSFCDCEKNIPLKIICNKCFDIIEQCCGYNCAFCFICGECGNGHPFVDLMV